MPEPPTPTRTALVSTLLDGMRSHSGGTWMTLAEHLADVLISDGYRYPQPCPDRTETTTDD